MSYTPTTDSDRKRMLESIGVESVDELFADLPRSILSPDLRLPKALSEQELKAHLGDLASQNASLSDYTSFLGAGVYHHYIPSLVRYVTSRAEFSTSYTPYQPEISQGNLQAMYEYQSLVCMLTGMDVANASLYDGATAVAEATIMAINLTNRSKVVLLPTLHPEYTQTTRAYLEGQATEVVVPALGDGSDRLADLIDSDTACLVVAQPNFLGQVEDIARYAKIAHQAGALLVVSINPIALGLLKAPGELGADIVVGEGQPLGLATNYGGPYLGLFACKTAHVRQMPGRIVGATVDKKGQRGFVLTFQTREQHIRREKATSNICSNEALCALGAAVYLSWMGPKGMREVAEICLKRAHYAASEIGKIPGFEPRFTDKPFFNEFVVKIPLDPETLNHYLFERGLIGPYPLARSYRDDPAFSNLALFCVTEMTPKAEIDRLVALLRRLPQEIESLIRNDDEIAAEEARR